VRDVNVGFLRRRRVKGVLEGPGRSDCEVCRRLSRLKFKDIGRRVGERICRSAGERVHSMCRVGVYSRERRLIGREGSLSLRIQRGQGRVEALFFVFLLVVCLSSGRRVIVDFEMVEFRLFGSFVLFPGMLPGWICGSASEFIVSFTLGTWTSRRQTLFSVAVLLSASPVLFSRLRSVVLLISAIALIVFPQIRQCDSAATEAGQLPATAGLNASGVVP